MDYRQSSNFCQTWGKIYATMNIGDLARHFEGLAYRKIIDILVESARVGRVNVTDSANMFLK